jgi:hypothetical protein
MKRFRWPAIFSKPIVTALLVTLLVGAMVAQMLAEAALDGASTDEQIHILSGYATITQGHILFDPEHPFLAKALAATPLLFLKPNIPDGAADLSEEQAGIQYNTYREANQWGFQMLFQSGNDPGQLLFWTRAVIAILTAILALVIFFWVRSVWGLASALAALALVAFEPSFIAHGHLANDDTVSTLLFIGSLALFWRFLHKPDKRNTALTGVVFGLGLITKYSLLLLGPIFVVIVIFWLLIARRAKQSASPNPADDNLPASHTSATHVPRSRFAQILSSLPFAKADPTTSPRSWKRYALGLVAIFVIAWSVIWISYGSLALINPAQNPTSLVGVPGLPEPLASLGSYILPAMYSKGAILLFGPGSHGRDGYLLGACYQGGRWEYFPIVTFFKTPLPTLMLFAIGIWLIWRNRRTVSFLPFVLAIAAVLYFAVSSQSDINIGYRHFLPVGALLIIAASYPFSRINWRVAAAIASTRLANSLSRGTRLSDNDNFSTRTAIMAASALIALGASIGGSLAWLPNHLAYYNLLSSEPHARPYISADSNADWGQATPALYRYMKSNDISHMALDNFTGTSEAEARGYPISPADPTRRDYSGYIALSRSTIIDHYCTKNNDWGWLVDNHQPVAIVGGSINVYKLP